MDVYAENILDHYRDPRGQGDLESPDAKHEEVNHSCGDAITVSLKIDDGCIQSIAWQGTGCAISQAAMSMLFEDLKDMTVEAAMQLEKDAMLEMLGVPIGARRMKCALLGLHALKNALRLYSGEGSTTWHETVDL